MMPLQIHQKRKCCRACGGERLRCFLSLGPTPLANSFLRSPEEFRSEASYPLDVYCCEACGLVQLLDVIHPEVLFRNYIYVTGTSDTIAAHNRQYAQTAVELLNLSPSDLVIEIASNDGSLLKCFQQHGVRTLGIEPASNIAEIARKSGIETANQFFNSTAALEIRAGYGPAKAVIGNNVLAHVDDQQDFLKGCKSLLTEDGLVIIEVPYLREMLDRLEYDTIYHEHLCYFSVSSLMRLCASAGLSLVRVDYTEVHGGSIRIYAGRTEWYGDHTQKVRDLLQEEARLWSSSFERFEKFACDVDRNRRDLLELLTSLKGAGKSLAAYGAPAKGNTLLNYCRIDTRLIPYTVDKSPYKVGLYTPGMHIPVLPVAALLEQQPDYVLILAWNFAEEIISQQEAYRAAGGKFIVPIPKPTIIE